MRYHNKHIILVICARKTLQKCKRMFDNMLCVVHLLSKVLDRYIAASVLLPKTPLKMESPKNAIKFASGPSAALFTYESGVMQFGSYYAFANMLHYKSYRALTAY